MQQPSPAPWPEAGSLQQRGALIGSHSQGLSSRNRVVTAKPFVLCLKAKVLFIELCLIVSFSRGVLVSKRHCHCLRISMPTFSRQTPNIEASLPSLCQLCVDNGHVSMHEPPIVPTKPVPIMKSSILEELTIPMSVDDTCSFHFELQGID